MRKQASIKNLYGILIQCITKQSNIKLRPVFTHLSAQNTLSSLSSFLAHAPLPTPL